MELDLVSISNDGLSEQALRWANSLDSPNPRSSPSLEQLLVTRFPPALANDKLEKLSAACFFVPFLPAIQVLFIKLEDE
jgi:hypothetical protein